MFGTFQHFPRNPRMLRKHEKCTSRAIARVPNALNGSFVLALYRPSSCHQMIIMMFINQKFSDTPLQKIERLVGYITYTN
jgi:hypothetical protein